MRKGWLAFLVSIFLHGVALAGLCLWPVREVERPAGSVFLQNGSDRAEDITITLVSTETMEMPLATAPPVPPPPPRETKPVSLPTLSHPDGPKEPVETSQAGGGNPSGTSAGTKGVAGTHPTFFNVPARGDKIVYLIDASASMGKHGELEIACAELLRSLRSLPPAMTFQIVVFNRTPFPLLAQFPDWLAPAPETLVMVEKALRALPAEGATNPRAALKYALSRQPTVLFFLTDADEMRMETVRDITLFNRGKSIVHVIELGTEPAAGAGLALELLAEHNHGVFRAVSLKN